jgi:hypothetical protein
MEQDTNCVLRFTKTLYQSTEPRCGISHEYSSRKEPSTLRSEDNPKALSEDKDRINQVTHFAATKTGIKHCQRKAKEERLAGQRGKGENYQEDLEEEVQLEELSR